MPVLCVVLAFPWTEVDAGLPHGLHTVEPTPAPPLDLYDLEQHRHSLEAFRGEVLVVNFWATWCLPCRQELPAMVETARALAGDGVEIVTVAMGQGREEVAEYVASYPFDLPKLLDPEMRAAEAWRAQGLPTSFVVDPMGRVVLQIVGAYDWSSPELRARLRSYAR